jgi:hypothetical protein
MAAIKGAAAATRAEALFSLMQAAAVRHIGEVIVPLVNRSTPDGLIEHPNHAGEWMFYYHVKDMDNSTRAVTTYKKPEAAACVQ